MTNKFTFQPIDWDHREEKKEWKNLVINTGDNWKIQQEKNDKFASNKNRRLYTIFKIEPVKHGNKNYIFIAFPLFTRENDGWGIEFMDPHWILDKETGIFFLAI